MNIRKHIPNTITLLNLACGVIASISAVQGEASWWWGLNGIQCSWIFVGLAAVFDFCDGAAARALKAYSELGKQLDSLSDLVSFGVAPSLMVYAMLIPVIGQWALLSIFIALMGALRLARFNIDTRQTTSFIGLPIPASAIFWIGATGWLSVHGVVAPAIVLALVFVISILMVSSLRMFSLKFRNFDWRENFRRYIIILAAILFVITDGVAGFAWTIILYILISAVGRKES